MKLHRLAFLVAALVGLAGCDSAPAAEPDAGGVDAAVADVTIADAVGVDAVGVDAVGVDAVGADAVGADAAVGVDASSGRDGAADLRSDAAPDLPDVRTDDVSPCGDCAPPRLCDGDGRCVCPSACDGTPCGEGECVGRCGSCPGGEECTPLGECRCPPCGARACGPDGCGGVCGVCGPEEYCASDGQCAAAPGEEVVPCGAVTCMPGARCLSPGRCRFDPALDSLVCGETRWDTNRGGRNELARYACVPELLDGPEVAYGLAVSEGGLVSLEAGFLNDDNGWVLVLEGALDPAACIAVARPSEGRLGLSLRPGVPYYVVIEPDPEGVARGFSLSTSCPDVPVDETDICTPTPTERDRCAPCLPDCVLRECGADGCGGRCGPGCGPEQACVDGRCEPLLDHPCSNELSESGNRSYQSIEVDAFGRELASEYWGGGEYGTGCIRRDTYGAEVGSYSEIQFGEPWYVSRSRVVHLLDAECRPLRDDRDDGADGTLDERTVWRYDAAGRLVVRESREGDGTLRERGRWIFGVDGMLETEEVEWGAAAQLVARTRRFAADGTVREVTETRREGGVLVTRTRTFDAAGRLVRLAVDASGGGASTTVETWTYDGAGRVTVHGVDGDAAAAADGHADVVETFEFDAAGRPVRRTQDWAGSAATADGAVDLIETVRYDAAGAPAVRERDGGPVAGPPDGVADERETWTYDDDGRLTVRETDGDATAPLDGVPDRREVREYVYADGRPDGTRALDVGNDGTIEAVGELVCETDRIVLTEESFFGYVLPNRSDVEIAPCAWPELDAQPPREGWTGHQYRHHELDLAVRLVVREECENEAGAECCRVTYRHTYDADGRLTRSSWSNVSCGNDFSSARTWGCWPR